jgi:dihydrofolate reductase
MKLSLMCAKSDNDVIGLDNTLPWKIRDDMKMFQKITKRAGFILMGRTTFESLGSKPLPERVNIILSSTMEQPELNDDVIVVDSIEEFHAMFDEVDCEIVIIGGSIVYDQFIDVADELYISEVDCIVEGDAFFPVIDYDKFDMETLECFTQNDYNEYGFVLNKYTRKA